MQVAGRGLVAMGFLVVLGLRSVPEAAPTVQTVASQAGCRLRPADSSGPVVLPNGVAWALTPPGHQRLTPMAICFAPLDPGNGPLQERATVLATLPPYQRAGSKPYEYFVNLQPAGTWLVVHYCHLVAEEAQPTNCRIDALDTRSSTRVRVWEGITTGGSHLAFGTGPGSALVFTGRSCPEDGVCVVEATLIRFADRTRRHVPIRSWPKTIAYQPGTFVVVGMDWRVYKVAVTTN